MHYVVEAPPVFFGHSALLIGATVLFPVAMAALVYALIAVSTSRDDLGAWPPVESRCWARRSQWSGALPSVP